MDGWSTACVGAWRFRRGMEAESGGPRDERGCIWRLGVRGSTLEVLRGGERALGARQVWMGRCPEACGPFQR